MKTVFLFAWLAVIGCQPKAQTQQPMIGGGCDGCEGMVIGMPRQMDATDTSNAWRAARQPLLVTGQVFRRDGRTPAPGVILYYWQTDESGYYANAPALDPRVKHHGHLRGWVKTDAEGRYRIYTARPAPYPGRDIPAHIHFSIQEPGLPNAYYPDDIQFDDDPLLLPALKKHPAENRCGSGIVRVYRQGKLQVAERNFILGLHIPHYPGDAPANNGVAIGEDQPSFSPIHAWGPDKGSTTCPVCKYGRYQGVLFFAGRNPDWAAIETWLRFLENESRQRGRFFKAYFVYGNDRNYDRDRRFRELEALGRKLQLSQVALTFVPSFTDRHSDIWKSGIDPEQSNTIIVYRNRNIIDKHTSLLPTAGNQQLLRRLLDRNNDQFFSTLTVHQKQHVYETDPAVRTLVCWLP